MARDLYTFSLLSNKMSSSTSSLASPLNIFATDDPVYGDVYSILQRNYIGSWGDACYLYDQIQREAIWSELTSMVQAKPTAAQRTRANSLLQDLQRFDTAANVTKAESVVRTWSPPPATTATGKPPVHPNTKKPKTANTKNSFALLNDDDE